MSWFYWSLLLVPLHSISWLILRKSQLKGLSSELSLLIFFIFSVYSLFIWHAVTEIPFVLPPITQTSILLLAGVFASLANIAMLHSFEKSENPGFSLAISSSKIILITFGSVLIFKDSLNFLALVGMLAIIYGIFLMYKNNTVTSFKWGILALAAAFFDVLYWLPLKYVDQRIPDLQLTVILVLVVIPQLIVLSIFVFKKREIVFKSSILKNTLFILALGGLMAALGNIVGIYAVLSAPNPGYALAIGSSYVILVAVISKLWFKSLLRPLFVLASVIIIMGVVIIRLSF
jgi:uncharacterized membrane protein